MPLGYYTPPPGRGGITGGLAAKYGPSRFGVQPEVPGRLEGNDYNRQPWDTFWGTGRAPNRPVDPKLQPLLDSVMAGAGASAGEGGAGGAAGVPRVTGPDPASRTAAEGAAFGRAKDRIGLATQGLIKAVRSNMAGRGISGSSIEREGVSGALNQGAGEVGDVIRDQAIEGLRRDQSVEDRNYSGDITQRGQDLSALQARRNYAFQILQSMISGSRY